VNRLASGATLTGLLLIVVCLVSAVVELAR
jgi:hypothetical protein